jgi:AbrB family looped-hinge helix DNA binding protein
MPVLLVDSKGRLTLPRRVRERLGIRGGDAISYTVVGGEFRMTKVQDPYAHMTAEELLAAEGEWQAAHPDEVKAMREEMEEWDAVDLGDLASELGDDPPSAD